MSILAQLASHARVGLNLSRRAFGELTVLVLIALIAGASWGFVELADEVTEGEVRAFDETILLSMRNPDDLADPLGPRWMEEMLRDITALGGVGVLVLLTVAVLGFLLLIGKTRIALLTAAASVSGMLLSTLLKQGFERPRPDLVPHETYVTSASFPSGHSLMAAVTYLTLGALLLRVLPEMRSKVYVLASAVVLTVLVGTSRIYLGVHWPTDVLAGWTAGAAWALLWWLIAHWLQYRGEIEAEA